MQGGVDGLAELAETVTLLAHEKEEAELRLTSARKQVMTLRSQLAEATATHDEEENKRQSWASGSARRRMRRYAAGASWRG